MYDFGYFLVFRFGSFLIFLKMLLQFVLIHLYSLDGISLIVADEESICPVENLIPRGNNKEAIFARTKLVKVLYGKWIKEHPDRKVWNSCLANYIYVKGRSVNETLAKAAITAESTNAVARLTEILSEAVVIAESQPKDNRNQRIFEKILLMEAPGNVRLLVGLQRSCQEYVQYSIRTK